MNHNYKKTLPEDVYRSVLGTDTTSSDTQPSALDVFSALATKNPFMHELVGLVHEHLYLAKRYYEAKLNVSPLQLALLMDMYSGLTFMEWRDRYILQAAYELLAKTPMHINKIAERLHFKDAVVFSRYFKKHTGESPKDWRWVNQKVITFSPIYINKNEIPANSTTPDTTV